MRRKDETGRHTLKSSWWGAIWTCLLCLFLLLTINSAAPTVRAADTTNGHQARILWDTWGVPHIYAQDDVNLFYAFGWAQMESHADLLLRYYGLARGQAAQYWGQSFLGSDERVRTFELPAHAQQWYDAQSPAFRSYINAFVAGINDYAARHPDQIGQDVGVVLPVRPTDVLAHLENILFNFVYAECGASHTSSTPVGSNGWAIGPSHTEGGQTMLLANPHLSWPGIDPKSGSVSLEIFYEAQLAAPGIDAYGAALVGLPVLSIAFNNFLSWTHTVNTASICSIYKLTTQNGGYLFDGEQRSFAVDNQTIQVKQPDGSLSSIPFVVRRAVQGPVIQENGMTLALRMVGIDQFPDYGALQEWWDMSRATNLAQFKQALQRLQLPMFMVLYADRSGNIMSLFNGQIPARSQGDWNYWSGIVPGDTSATLWTTLLPFSALPRVIDPSTGWVQNSNSPPWYTTVPQVLFPQAYPSYMAPQFLDMREQRGIDMLMQSPRMSFDTLINDKFSSYEELANRVLPDLVSAAQTYGNSLAKQAATVLQAWDRTTNADSRGAVLFNFWVSTMQGNLFAVPWDANHPLTTPSGLANPQEAASALGTVAQYIQSTFGSLDVPWGNVYRLHLGNADYPASGGGADGVFRVLAFAPTANPAIFQAQAGDTYIAAVDFSSSGVHARVLMTYGNSTQPGSPHISDQLALYAHNQMRDAWFTFGEVAAHVASSETL